jgi:hypothetical protein
LFKCSAGCVMFSQGGDAMLCNVRMRRETCLDSSAYV